MERPGFLTVPAQPHPLAPDAPVQPSVMQTSEMPPEEEKELRQVALFVDLLGKEHSKRLGFKAEAWQKLFQFWFKHIRDATCWRPMTKRRPRRIEDSLLEGMLMIDTQKRLYGNEPWFCKDQELSRAEVITWMTTLDSDDVHFTLYMYYDGGWKERLAALESSRARLRARTERAMRRPLSATQTGEPAKPIDRGSAIAEHLLNSFQKSKGFSSSDIPTLIEFWKHKARKNKIWALYSEADIKLTLECYYQAKEEAAKKQRTEAILSVMQQKPKPKAKTLPKNFAKHVFDDYKEKRLVFDLIKRHFAEKKVYSNDPTAIFEFWAQKDAHYSQLKSSMTEQDQVSVQRWRETMSFGEGSTSVKKLVDNFFSRGQLLARILAIYQYSFGFPADSAVKALALWKRLEPAQRYECGVHYEPETQLKDFLVSHFRKEPAPPPPAKVKREPSRETINKLAKSKSRWTLEENIAVLAKRFPYDTTIKHMLARERSLTPHVRYPSEYDVFHRDEESLRKMRLRTSISGSPKTFDRKRKEEQMRIQADKIRILEGQASQEDAKVKQEVARMHAQIRELAKGYLEKREHGRPSVTLFLGAAYSQLKAAFPVATKRTFPFANYGAVKQKDGGRSTFANAYPLDFKIFFFQVVRGFLKTPAGAVFLRSLPTNTWAPPSKTRCMLHHDIDCPPNCRYVTHNRGALKQTFQHMKLNLSFFDQLKPWRRPDTEQQREKIFMNFNDARECIFEPVIGSRVPKKQMDLATSLYPGVNQVFSNEKADFDLWVGKLGKNFAARDPLLFKIGVYKKARVLFFSGKYQLMLEMLNDHFNVPSIVQHFSGDKTVPMDSDKPAENFNDPHSRALMEKVYDLVANVQVERKTMNFQITLLNREDKGKVTQQMCPLGAQCPLNAAPPPGVRSMTEDKRLCPYAHHPFQLRFARESASRKTARQKAITKLNLMMGSNLERRPWIPDGRVQECGNCKVTFVSNALLPGQEKGNSCSCNKCALEQRLRDKEKTFKALSQRRQEQKQKKRAELAATQAKPPNAPLKPGQSLPSTVQPVPPMSQSLPPKPAKKVKLENKHAEYSKKLGLYRRASTLWNTGRLPESWQAIQEALQLVRADRAAEHERNEAKKRKWQAQLGIKDLPDLDGDMSHRSASLAPGQSLAQAQNVNLYKQKLEKLARPNNSHFLNHQIDLLCLSISAAIQAQKRDVQRLYEAAEQIEDRKGDAADDPSKLPPLLRPKKRQMCEFVLRGEKCPHGDRCPNAHYAIQLDLVSSDKVVQHMRQTVEVQEMRLKQGGSTLQVKLPPQPDLKPLPEVMRDLTKDIDLTRNPFD